MGKYDATRYNHNLNRYPLELEGPLGIPRIAPVRDLDPPPFTAFDFAVTRARKGRGDRHGGVHFFRDDYRFDRLWSDPDAYVPMLRGYDVVLSPDFSTYVDWPVAVQAYNHFRKHWLGAYLQSQGCTVVPTISLVVLRRGAEGRDRGRGVARERGRPRGARVVRGGLRGHGREAAPAAGVGVRRAHGGV